MLVTLKVSQSTIRNLLYLNQGGGLETWVEDNDHACFNTDQNLSFDPVARTVTYHGQRCPFWQDGLATLLGEAMTGLKPGTREHHIAVDKAFQDAEVLEYQTSDSRLYWWDTLESYLSTRAPLAEAVSEAVRLAKREELANHRPGLVPLRSPDGSRCPGRHLGPGQSQRRVRQSNTCLRPPTQGRCTGIASW
jgi:hypothetical protein